MQIVSSLPVLVESLSVHPALLPSAAELRPTMCPGCRQPAFEVGKPLQIVGHGTYERQVLGIAEATKEVVIPVRRYLCRGCARTISVLPDELYPGRWYAAGAILLILFRKLMKGETAEALRAEIGTPGDTPGWRTPRRWCRQLMSPLWYWLAGQLGIGSGTSSIDRLRRLLGLRGLDGTSADDEVTGAARELTTQTMHEGRAGMLQSRHAARSQRRSAAATPGLSSKPASTEEVSPAEP